MLIGDILEQIHGNIFGSGQRLNEIRMSRIDFMEFQKELIEVYKYGMMRAGDRFVTAYGSVTILIDPSIPKDTAIFTSSYNIPFEAREGANVIGTSWAVEVKKIDLVTLKNIEVRKKSARQIEIGEW